MSATVVDALGTWCPVPLRLLGRALAGRPPGEEAVLLADDPLIEVDLAAWCHRHGHELLTLEPDPAGGWRAVVRRGDSPLDAPAGDH